MLVQIDSSELDNAAFLLRTLVARVEEAAGDSRLPAVERAVVARAKALADRLDPDGAVPDRPTDGTPPPASGG